MRKLLSGLLLAIATFGAQAQISGAVIPVICSDGTAASPCYTFTSAVNKGFWSPSTNTVGISIAGTNVGTWSSTGYSSPFATTGTSFFASGGAAPATTTGGIQIWGGPTFGELTLIDTGRTANNKVFDISWNAGAMLFRLMNDAQNAAVTPFSISGGQAAGITGITSNSGSGSWVHTGSFSTTGMTTVGGGGGGYLVSGNVIAVSGSKALGVYYSNGSTGTIGGEASSGGMVVGYGTWPGATAANFVSSTAINITRSAYTQDGNHYFYTGPLSATAVDSAITLTKQFQIAHVLGATNYLSVGGANAGSPSIYAEGTSANISTSYGAKGSGSHLFYADWGSATLQFEVRRTASATNWVYVTGSNGGNPKLSTSAGSLLLASTTGSVFTSGNGAAGVGFGIGGDGGVSTGDVNLSLGFGRTNSGFAYIDLIGDTTYSTFGFRIIRSNTGANATTQLSHHGTGDMQLMTNEAASISFYTGGTQRFYIPPAQNAIHFNNFLFANIGTNMVVNGDIGYCSDCTIANPCAGGGTGAFSKRLNGVNVCN